MATATTDKLREALDKFQELQNQHDIQLRRYLETDEGKTAKPEVVMGLLQKRDLLEWVIGVLTPA